MRLRTERTADDERDADDSFICFGFFFLVEVLFERLLVAFSARAERLALDERTDGAAGSSSERVSAAAAAIESRRSCSA